jgi:hypothetical protein
MNPTAPTLKAKIKIHKPTAPIRPIINNINAPSYKIATYMQQKLKELVQLENQYNCINSATFAEDITRLHLHDNYKFLTLDIKDLYVNIPIQNTLHITKLLLHKHKVNKYVATDTLNISETILNQNYFQYEGNFHKPKTGIAMGSPLSGIIAEIFIQHLQHQLLKHTLENKTIICYTRYVDIFIVYNLNRTTLQHIQEQFNKQHKAMKFTITEENNRQIAVLDLNIYNKQGRIEIDIYRKPTYTDTTINNSCHPGEHKMAAFKNWIHTIHKLPLQNANKIKELNTIANIAESNGYNRKQIIRLDNAIRINEHQKTAESKDQKKWVTFTYTGNYIRTITKLFKHTKVQIAFKTRNTIGNLLKEMRNINKLEQAGIYRLKCMDCQKVYIGQTGRSLNIRYKEHIRSIRYNREDSGYATHILNNIHRYGKIEDIMERIDKAKKDDL